MRIKTIFTIVTALLVFSVSQASAATPGIFNLVIDASGSVAQEDFQKAKAAAIFFIDQINKRAQRRPGQLSDWISVNYFGGDDDYQGTRFINCSNFQEMLSLARYTMEMDHPKYGNTAIYTAVGKAFVEEIQQEKKLDEPDGTYLKNILLITDGADNSSNSQLKQVVQQAFPNNQSNLIIIAVGSGSDVSEFRDYADMIIKIDNFGKLTPAIMMALDQM